MFHRSIFTKLVLLVAFSVSLSAAIGNNLTVVRASDVDVIDATQAQCPKVTVNSPAGVKAGDPLMFTGNVSGGDKNVTPTYNWSVSAGSISSGQGTSTITVDTTGMGGQSITATIDVGGFERTCSTYASATTSVDLKAEAKKSNEYGAVKLEDERSILDNFLIEIQNDPTAQGYLIAYGGPGSTPAKLNAATKRAKDHLVTKRGLDPSRLIIVIGGERATAVTELWLVPTGATPPTPTPAAAPSKTTPATPKKPATTKKKS